MARAARAEHLDVSTWARRLLLMSLESGETESRAEPDRAGEK